MGYTNTVYNQPITRPPQIWWLACHQPNPSHITYHIELNGFVLYICWCWLFKHVFLPLG